MNSFQKTKPGNPTLSVSPGQHGCILDTSTCCSSGYTMLTTVPTSSRSASRTVRTVRGVGEVGGRGGSCPPTFESWGVQPLQFFTSTHAPFLTRPLLNFPPLFPTCSYPSDSESRPLLPGIRPRTYTPVLSHKCRTTKL